MILNINNNFTEIEATKAEKSWLESFLVTSFTEFRRHGSELVPVSVPKSFLTNKGILTGLVPEVRKRAEDDEVDVIIKDWRKIPGVPREVPETLGNIDLRDYQINAAQTLIQATRGVVDLPPASGKSEIMIAAIRAVEKAGSVCVLVNRDELLRKEWIPRLKSRGVPEHKIGEIKAGTWKPKKITVAMLQTLHRRLTQQPTRDYLNSVTTWVIDEVHLAGAQSYADVGLLMNNAYWRWGVSANTLDYGKARNFQMIGLTGGQVFFKPLKEMVDAMYISDIIYHTPIVPMLNVEDKHYGMDFESLQQEFIYNNPYHRSLIRTVTNYHNKERILIFVNRLDHGRYLREGIPDAEFAFATGMSRDRRNNIIDAFYEGELRVLIASPIADYGLDFQELPVVINAGGLKSPHQFIQRMGRGMRLKAGNKPMHYYDPRFDGVPMLDDHSQERLRIMLKHYPEVKVVTTICR